MSLPPQLVQAEELGIRLEIMNGLAIWEAQPLYRHQKHVQRIMRNIVNHAATSCACVYATDVYIQFPDGLKRPDIAIFCREPSEEEQDSALTMIPEAVIEVVSKGYEAKDLQLGPPFYLAQGVKDVIVFNPMTLEVLHFRNGFKSSQASPVKINFECGCCVEV